jgi:hypothetical protein
LRRKFPNRKKPGFPLQVLGFAYANPVGFPLQSLAPRSERICRMQIRGQPGRMGEQQNCVCNFATSPLARPGFYQILNRLLEASIAARVFIHARAGVLKKIRELLRFHFFEQFSAISPGPRP